MGIMQLRLIIQNVAEYAVVLRVTGSMITDNETLKFVYR